MVGRQCSTRSVIVFCFFSAVSLLVVFSWSTISIQLVALEVHEDSLLIEPSTSSIQPSKRDTISVQPEVHLNDSLQLVEPLVESLTIIQQPKQGNDTTNSSSIEQHQCFARVVATHAQEKLCPKLNPSILYGEVFPINCSDTSNFSVEQYCKNTMSQIYQRLNGNVNGVTFNSSATTTSLDPHYLQCSTPEQYKSLEMPQEWSYYQLIDQSQRLCGLRKMHCQFANKLGRVITRSTNCSYDDLHLPEGSLAREIGDKCAIANDPKADHDAIFRSVVQERHHGRQEAAPRPTDVVVHVRIGDVVDNAHHSVRELLQEPRAFYPETLLKTVYVKPFSYYDKVIPDSILEGTTTVYLVGGVHAGCTQATSLPRLPIKSCMYVHALREYFLTQRKVKSVELRLGRTPDEDVVFMTQSKQFVRGGGGFSRVMGELVEHFGGTVLGREED